MADSTDIDPISIFLVKKGCGSDRLLFRYPYANPTRPSTNSAGPTSSGGGSGVTTAAIPPGLVTNTITILFSFPLWKSYDKPRVKLHASLPWKKCSTVLSMCRHLKGSLPYSSFSHRIRDNSDIHALWSIRVFNLDWVLITLIFRLEMTLKIPLFFGQWILKYPYVAATIEYSKDKE